MKSTKNTKILDLFRWGRMQKWLPVFAIVVTLSGSFFYSWYFDGSKPVGGLGWADQSVYTRYAQNLRDGILPRANDLVYAIGYPLLGAIGAFFNYDDPFMPVSLSILLSSALLCYYAAKKHIGSGWSMSFVLLLFASDFTAKTFHFSAELFAIPWNNQVLFFMFAYFFWLYSTRLKVFSWRLAAISALVVGLTFVTREESIIFGLPLLGFYLFKVRAPYKLYLVSLLTIAICFTPQLIIKKAVLGSYTGTGRSNSYSDVRKEYLQPSLLYRNSIEVLLDSRAFIDRDFHPQIAKQCVGKTCSKEPNRDALLRAAPWLLLSPIGVYLILKKKRYRATLGLFALITLGLMVFYLSGANMAALKLKFHAIRYITPSLILLNFATVVTLREATSGTLRKLRS